MAKQDGESRWRKRVRLYFEQGGLCYYCREEMWLQRMPAQIEGPLPKKLCTFEHLDDRFSPNRGKLPGQKRVVAACAECNAKRGKESEIAAGVYTLRLKARLAKKATGRPFDDERLARLKDSMADLS